MSTQFNEIQNQLLLMYVYKVFSIDFLWTATHIGVRKPRIKRCSFFDKVFLYIILSNASFK